MGLEFKKGRYYRFNKERFLEDSIKSGEDAEVINLMMSTWVEEIEGMMVVLSNSRVGMIDGYRVHPEWCDEYVRIGN